MSRPPKSPQERAHLLQLMAYADDELDEEARAVVEDALTREPHSVETVEAFRGLGEWLRNDLPASPDLTDAIMAKLLADAPAPMNGVVAAPAGPANRVHDGAAVLDVAAARARRYKLGAVVASLAAAAAAVAFWVGRPPAAEEELAGRGVEVERVDSQENVTVFSIPALHSNASSVVVWLGDDHQDDESQQPSTEPALDAAPRGEP